MRLTNLVLLAMGILALSGCSSDSGNGNTLNSGTTIGCTVSVGTVSGNYVPLTISAYGGTANYGVSAISLSGASPTSVTGSTSFASSTTLTGYFSSVTSFSNVTGTVTIVDSASQSASCAYTVNPTTTTTTGTSNGCTVTASSSNPGVNQDVYLTFTGTSGYPSYSFSSLSSGGTSIVSPLTTVSSSQATATVRPTAIGTYTVSGVVVDANGTQGSCSTVLTVSSSTYTGTSPTCTLTHTVSGNSVIYSIASSTGGAITLNSFSPGDGGTYSSLTNPIYATYSTAGQKYATAIAYSGGALCNGTGYVTDSVYVSGGSTTSGLACTASFSTNPMPAGYYVDANVTITTTNYGAQLTYVYFPGSSGIGGYLSGQLSARMYFLNRGTFAVDFVVQDAYGQQATCRAYQTVY